MTRDHPSEPFSALIKVPEKSKLVFKFVIDGHNWTTSDTFKVETDEHGNPNNYVDATELVAVEEFVEVKEEPKPQPKAEEPKAEEPVAEEPAVEVAEKPTKAPEGQEDELFARVLTSESSYASVSLASGDDSAFEHVSQDSGHAGEASNRTAPEEITPTNTVGEGKTGTKTTGAPQLSDSEVTTLGPSSRNNSFTGGLQSAEGEAVNKSAKLGKREIEPGTRRRDGLMLKLRGLFRS